MTRIIAVIIVFMLVLSLTACENTEKSRHKDDDENDKNPLSVIIEKTGVQKLTEYLLENGANYQGIYQIIEMGTNNCTVISCAQDNTISFYYSHDSSGKETSVSLDLYEGSVTQTVSFTYEELGYTITANGTIGTTLVNVDDCSVVGITYRDNCPSYVTDESIEAVVNGFFPTATKAMLASVNAMLAEYVGIELKDLGFTNW